MVWFSWSYGLVWSVWICSLVLIIHTQVFLAVHHEIPLCFSLTWYFFWVAGVVSWFKDCGHFFGDKCSLASLECIIELIAWLWNNHELETGWLVTILLFFVKLFLLRDIHYSLFPFFLSSFSHSFLSFCSAMPKLPPW